MFMELEDRQKELGILSFGVSLTTLEEVFLKVGTDPIKQLEINGNHDTNSINTKSSFGEPEWGSKLSSMYLI